MIAKERPPERHGDCSDSATVCIDIPPAPPPGSAARAVEDRPPQYFRRAARLLEHAYERGGAVEVEEAERHFARVRERSLDARSRAAAARARPGAGAPPCAQRPASASMSGASAAPSFSGTSRGWSRWGQ